MKRNFFNQMFKIALAGFLVILSNISCSFKEGTKDAAKDIARTLRELAYDVDKGKGYTVFISEMHHLTPYLVLTDDYCGNALLLRKEILKENCPFDKDGSSYYENSTVDLFLTQDVIQRYSPEIQKIIENSKISITQDVPNWNSTKVITRKIFLLSCTELQINSGLHTKEGIPLKYFSAADNKKAQLEGKNMSWGLRSTYTGSGGLSWCVAPDLTVGGGGVQLNIGIRPAICISADVQVRRIKHEGKYIYCILLPMH